MGGIIRGSSHITTVETYNQNSFRSNFMIPIVKHCFETTFVSGCKGYHTGFSPSSTERIFVSHWALSSSNVPIFIEIGPNIDGRFENYLEVKEGSIVMVCLDSMNSLITAKVNNEERNHTIIKISDTKTWYAFIDAGANCKSPNKATVKVNLGKKKFNNTMPEGYAPFVYGYYDIINCVRCTNVNRGMHPLLYCLMIFVLVSS